MTPAFVKDRVLSTLRARLPGADSKGYLQDFRENLLPGIKPEQFEGDLEQGDGNELNTKFRAVHSSSALAVNTFARFKADLAELRLLGESKATALAFEKQLEITEGRRKANLDVWVERQDSIIAIESKFLEYFTPKKAEFAEIYEQLKPPFSESSWWSLYQDAKAAPAIHLDQAQLIKHYLGLRNFQQRHSPSKKLTLLYLFWEPKNWMDVPICTKHREQVEHFAERTAESSVSFRWMTYPQLWEEWSEIPSLQAHVSNLRSRYEIVV